MKGLYRVTGYWQTQAAKEDWAAIAGFASQNGLENEANKLTPPDNWGWRRIDNRIAKLREALTEVGLEFIVPSARMSV